MIYAKRVECVSLYVSSNWLCEKKCVYDYVLYFLFNVVDESEVRMLVPVASHFPVVCTNAS